MQTLAIENTNGKLLNVSKFFAQESLLLDSELNGFEVVTENNIYTFIKTGKTLDGAPKWYVIDGQQDIIGKEVEILGLSKTGLSFKVNRGDSLAIYLEQEPTIMAKIWYTTKILNFSIIK
ncbi:MAG: hypothetical protein HY819_21805 [Acidobacteria bacterium]|nr:hypothetical protein [Acidobacteriota bacterium]